MNLNDPLETIEVDDRPTLDYEDVAPILKRLVAETPDRRAHCTYATMEYDTESETYVYAPACIVGHVLAELGTDFEPWFDDENEGAVNVTITEDYRGNVSWELAPLLPVKLTPEAAQYLRTAQRAQDEGQTWAEAVALADGVRESVNKHPYV
jgi:hypothetical protein